MIQHDDALKAQRSLDRSVAKALERKRRLGQYAVVWRDGCPAFIGPNSPKLENRHPQAASADPRFSGVREPDHPSD